MILATSLAFFLVVFLLASIAVAIAYLGFIKMRAEQSAAAESDLEIAEQERKDAGQQRGLPLELSPLLSSDRLSTITFWDHLLARLDVVAILKTRLEQASLNWSVGRVTSMMLLTGTVVLAILLRFIPAWGALLGGVGGMFLPYAYILRRRERRFQKFRENFPDVLDSLARALRAGYPLSAAMEMIAGETAQPVSGELRRTSAEANLGRGWPQALESLGRRVPLVEVNMFIGAAQLHARTGGKLSEVIGDLAENMREALALRGEVKALAAHGKLTGAILTILPVGIAVMMLIVSPGYMQTLFQHPWGKMMIAGAAGCLIAAHFLIRKIVDIEI
jgi:tight adherence protein B